MTKTYKQTLAASLTALLVAAPALAQQDQTNQAQQQTDQSTQQQTDQAQNQGSEAEMPEAATPEGQGLSDIADVETPPGEVGADSDTTTADTQATTGTQGTDGQQGATAGEQGRMVMLDVEGFSQQIYERGFRQGYIRGISDARDRFMAEMERSRSMLQGRGMTGGQAGGQQTAEDGAGQTGQQPQAMQQQDQQMAGDGSGERGTIIVLPPGVTPEMFVDRLMQQGG